MSSTSETPTRFISVERTGGARWPTTITSPKSKGSSASSTDDANSPDDESPRRGSKPPEEMGRENQPNFTNWQTTHLPTPPSASLERYSPAAKRKQPAAQPSAQPTETERRHKSFTSLSS
ncbi:hypothetical protein C2845_PM03G19080 [Panicum miliaceum]|uniref:Uncharacterized protein n=1 Tax=Panicum miliaceum TaxID=4540 RepID=A0A3L6T663_PANMI|nr:hypothetical protein C2845_PM03G19080 [Panicum miliaceum]